MATTTNTTTDPGGGPAPTKLRSTVDKVLDNPLAGIAPWIVLSLLAGPGRLEESALITLAMSLALVAGSILRGKTVKFLELSDSVFFIGLTIIGLFGSESVTSWMESWIGELSNIAVLLIAVGSIAVRRPFTLQYAKEDTPEEQWDSPVFLSINYAITWVWAAAFMVSALAGAFGNLVLENNGNLWTGWIIQVGAMMVAVQFTQWYPDHATATYLQGIGEETEPPTPVLNLLIPVVGLLVTVGIVALIFDAGPWWVGVGFIVAGSVGGSQLTRLAGDDQEASDASRPAGVPGG